MSDDRVVEVSVHIAAQPETVFPYFTDPGRYVQWMGAGAGDRDCALARICAAAAARSKNK